MLLEEKEVLKCGRVQSRFDGEAALAATKGEMTTSELSRNTRLTGHK